MKYATWGPASPGLGFSADILQRRLLFAEFSAQAIQDWGCYEITWYGWYCGIVTTGSLTDESRLLGKLTLRHIVGLTGYCGGLTRYCGGLTRYCGSPTLSWDWSTLCVGLLDSSQPPVSSRRETFLLSRLFTEDIFANAQLGHSSLSAFSPCQINKDQQTVKPSVDYFNFILQSNDAMSAVSFHAKHRPSSPTQSSSKLRNYFSNLMKKDDNIVRWSK